MSETPGSEAVIDVHHADPWSARIEHGVKRHDSVLSSAVPSACRNRNDGLFDESADHAWQYAIHSGNNHEDPSFGEFGQAIEKSMEARDANIVYCRHRAPEDFRCDFGFLSNGNIRGAGRDNDDPSSFSR